MAADSVPRVASLERLSALIDGELDDSTVALTCTQWRNDATLRAAWHEYQLIGDVLRSDDLAASARHDAAFLQTLRVRLSNEPVVLAPQARTTFGPIAAVDAQARRWSWKVPSAVAAGFMAVAGVLMVTRGPGGPLVPPSASVVAAAPVAVPVGSLIQPVGTTAVSAAAIRSEPEVLVVSGEMLRDARLDRYMAAHKQFAGSSALGVPSAFLRSATADASNR